MYEILFIILPSFRTILRLNVDRVPVIPPILFEKQFVKLSRMCCQKTFGYFCGSIGIEIIIVVPPHNFNENA